jgi:replication factor C large subunit
MLLTEKYAPHRYNDIIGNHDAVERVRKWAESWSRGERPTPLLLYGPPGIGKTTLAYVSAHEMGWEILETNASDVRKKSALSEILGPAASEGTLSGRMRLIIIDEVDSINPTDRGAVSAIVDVIEKARQPIILIANDAYVQKLKELRSVVEFVEMRRISAREIFGYLKRIVDTEHMDVSFLLLKDIADASDGDVRSAITDLQAYVHVHPFSHQQPPHQSPHQQSSHQSHPSQQPPKQPPKQEITLSRRDRTVDIYRALGYMFKAENFQRARSALWDVDIDPETLMLWIAENIPNEYDDADEIAHAYDRLSRADVFEGRIRKRQYWGLRRYSTELATAGVAAAKKAPYKKFTKYRFPNVLREMSTSVLKRAILNSIASKVGKKMHLSKKDTLKDFHILVPIILANPSYYQLDDSEITFLKKYH